MKAYKTYLTITDPKQIILSDVPFRAGEKVEVVILSTEENRRERARELKELFEKTQSLPQVQALSEEDILREIEAHRNGK